MRWAMVSEKPPKDGQYYCHHHRLGKCVMGYAQGSWGSQVPDYWLENDGCPHQASDGSFGRGEVLTQSMDSKAYPIEDEL